MAGYHAVILAGGRGERFWPWSTRARPKQLLPLLGGTSLLRQAVDRLEGLIPPERILVVTRRDLAAACAEAVPSLPPGRILSEPVGRDTGAAVAAAAGALAREDPEAVFCVLTADHRIPDRAAFQRILRAALDLAAGEDALVTLGIPPTEPSPAYGYIEAGAVAATREGVPFHRILRFTEKPGAALAREFLRDGRHYWNSGMFLWSVRSLEAALRRHAPALAALAERMRRPPPGPAFEAELAEAYPALPPLSIDRALMEKASNGVMARADFDWDDLGSWPALERHLPRDGEENAVLGDCEALDASGNLVVSPGRLTALIGVRDLVVVQAEGVTLVCPKARAQEVRALVARMAEAGRPEV